MENVTGGQAPCHIKTGTKHHDEVCDKVPVPLSHCDGREIDEKSLVSLFL